MNRFAPSYGNPRRPQPASEKPSLTKQEFAQEADINYIANRALRTGQPPMTGFGIPMRASNRKPIYGDFTAHDYHGMLNTVADIQTKFNMLPARIRSKFRGSPETLMRWLEDEKNYDEAVKLGLLVPDEAHEEALDASKPKTDPNQIDLVDEAAKAQNEGQKADDEAQPGFGRKPSKNQQKAR